MLLTQARYIALTGDSTGRDPSEVSAAVEDATSLLADALGRPLEEAEYTERLRIYYADEFPGGRVFPSSTPITDPGDLELIGTTALAGAGPISAPWFDYTEAPYASVTYTGGFVERSANPTATNRLPVCIERDLAAAVYASFNVSVSSQIPAGATAVRLGDASVSFGGHGYSGGQSSTRWSYETLRYKRRTP